MSYNCEEKVEEYLNLAMKVFVSQFGMAEPDHMVIIEIAKMLQIQSCEEGRSIQVKGILKRLKARGILGECNMQNVPLNTEELMLIFSKPDMKIERRF